MSREIKNLSPFMQQKAKLFLAECRKEKLDVVIICTDRGQKEQEAAFRRGDSKARYGRSAHNVLAEDGTPSSEAFDIGVIRYGKYVGDGKDSHYQKAGIIGERLGLKWAGRWTIEVEGIVEVAHFQNPTWVSPRRERKGDVKV